MCLGTGTKMLTHELYVVICEDTEKQRYYTWYGGFQSNESV